MYHQKIMFIQYGEMVGQDGRTRERERERERENQKRKRVVDTKTLDS